MSKIDIKTLNDLKQYTQIYVSDLVKYDSDKYSTEKGDMKRKNSIKLFAKLKSNWSNLF